MKDTSEVKNTQTLLVILYFKAFTFTKLRLLIVKVLC